MPKTAIVTGASQGIGADIVTGLRSRGYRIVANSRKISKSMALVAGPDLILIDGDIADSAVAAGLAETAVSRFGSIDVLVNNAGIFFSKPFVDYTIADIRSLISVNLEGFLHITQHAIRRMLTQKSGGNIVTISASLADNPIAGVPMMTKGGLNAMTRSLAMEYAKAGIRVNAVAPGVVDTPMHADAPKEALSALSPMGGVSTVRDVTDAVLYLTEATRVTGEVMYVDGGAHFGKW
jgi:NAD(P)-dependent dehydrogenase (short-subunit alcohol dehydrogenase family)